MTKEQYFEMCEMLGSEPLEEEIPVELYDLPLEVQEAYRVYTLLNDNWDSFGGNYLGKNMSGLLDIMNILKIDDKVTILSVIQILDRNRMNQVQAQMKAKKSATEK
jgi:hypothetical protein